MQCCFLRIFWYLHLHASVDTFSLSILLKPLATLSLIIRKMAWLLVLLIKSLFAVFFPLPEKINTTIIFRYVECTSAAIQALTSFKKLYPGHRREEIDSCIRKAANFIEKIQEPNGSWSVYSFWSSYLKLQLTL